MFATSVDDNCSSKLDDHGRIGMLQDTLDTVDRFTAAIRDLYWSVNYKEPSISDTVVLAARQIVHEVVKEFLDELDRWEQPLADTDDADVFGGEAPTTDLAGVFYSARPVSPNLKDHELWEDLARRSLSGDPLTRDDFKSLNALAGWLADGILSELDGPTTAAG